MNKKRLQLYKMLNNLNIQLLYYTTRKPCAWRDN